MKIELKEQSKSSSSAVYLVLKSGSYWGIFKKLHTKGKKKKNHWRIHSAVYARDVIILLFSASSGQDPNQTLYAVKPDSQPLCSAVFPGVYLSSMTFCFFASNPLLCEEEGPLSLASRVTPLTRILILHPCSLQFLSLLLFFLFSLFGTAKASRMLNSINR